MARMGGNSRVCGVQRTRVVRILLLALLLGPHLNGLLMSSLLIIIPSVLFLGLIALDISGGAFTYSFLLMIFCISMLGLTAFSNPGVIPRDKRPYNEPRNPVVLSSTRDHQINGYTVTTKYCTTCCVYRIPRCSHCTVCDNCVEKFDHYCPWVGTCIGRRNYRFFLLFVLSATVMCISVFALSLYRLVKLSENHQHSFARAIEREPVAILLIAYTFVAAWFVGGLTVFHSYLVMTNQTTYEHFRRRFGRSGNPYDRGLFKNIVEVRDSFASKISNWPTLCCCAIASLVLNLRQEPLDSEVDLYQYVVPQTCFKRIPPYGWDGDGDSHPPRTRPRLGLPQGIIVDPTLIAMQDRANCIASQELPPRAPSSYVSDRVVAKMVSPCAYGSNPCRVHSIAKESEITSLDYQDSIYTTASSNFDEHVQQRLAGLSQNAFGPRPYPMQDIESMGSFNHQEAQHTGSGAISSAIPAGLPCQEDAGLSQEAWPTSQSLQSEEDQEDGKDSENINTGENHDIGTPSSEPCSSVNKPVALSPNLSIELDSLSREDCEHLKKDGPNPFASSIPLDVEDDEFRQPVESTCLECQQVEPQMESPEIAQEENSTSQSGSVVEPAKYVESPKAFRVLDGGFHGMMGHTRIGYAELKDDSIGSDVGESHTSGGKTPDNSSGVGSQFRVPEFASRKLNAALRSIKTVSGHIIDKAGRSSAEPTQEEETGGVTKAEAFGDPATLQQSSWRGAIRKSSRQSKSFDRSGGEQTPVVEEADILL